MSKNESLPEQASIDRLQQIARVLDIPVGTLIDSAHMTAAGKDDRGAVVNPTSAEILDWLDRIHDAATRRALLAVVRSFVANGG